MRRGRRGRGGAAGTAVLLVVLTGCTGGPSAGPATPASPSTSTTSAPSSPTPDASPGTAAPSPTRSPHDGPRLDTWRIGAHVLPLRPDGFGQVRRTPRQLRVRVMPTVEELPPPRTEHYTASIGRITPWVRKRMGTSWAPGCPVALRRLAYLRVAFIGFDRRPHTGELIVRRDQARGVVQVFRRLYDARFPIEQMTLPRTAKPDRTPTGDGNGTAATVCRPTRGETFWSAHALGLAIDVNPFQNPYVKGDLVLPELASAYRDRSWHRPGMIRPNGLVVRAFRDIGWSWGGDWRSLKDYQHFSATGR